MGYPTNIDSFPTEADGQVLYAAKVNAITAAIRAIEQTLGTNPQGVYASVAAALAVANTTPGPTGATGPAGATGPTGAAGINWQGAWNTSSTYSASDAVTRTGSTYRALTAVPANQDPAISPAAVTDLAGVTNNPSLGFAGGGHSFTQSFTTGASPLTGVNGLRVYYASDSHGGTVEIGIATSIGGAPSGVTFAANPMTVVMPISQVGYLDATFTTINLAANTTYWVVIREVVVPGAQAIAFINGSPTLNGGLASVSGTVSDAGSSGASWTPGTGYTMAWRLLRVAPYWQQLAAAGATGPAMSNFFLMGA